MKDLLTEAIMLACEVHQGRTDKGDHPYIRHPLRVMEGLKTDDLELLQIAVLHDVLEDSEDPAIHDRVRESFSERVYTALMLLTHKEDTPYEKYIEAIRHNMDAMKVKLADLEENLNVLRLKRATQIKEDKIAKYYNAYQVLKEHFRRSGR